MGCNRVSSTILTIGVPREVKPGEMRVGITPQGVLKLRQAGILVLVEKGAGLGSGYPDEQFRKARAQIVATAQELYQNAGLIEKVKEPFPSEWKFLKPNLVLFCFLHLASPENRKLVDVLLEKKVTGIGLETVEKDGRTIFLEPMSEIAGTLAAYYAGFFKRSVKVKKGRIVYPDRFPDKLQWLASQYPEVPENLRPGDAVVYGGGNAGRKATEMILKMGGKVDLIEKREDRRRALCEEFKKFGPSFRVRGLEDKIEEVLRQAEVWIGCVHVAGKRAPLVLKGEDLERLCKDKPKLILDIAVDQGGNFPGTRSSTYEDPLYLDSIGNLRFGVTNVPSLCGGGASEAIERVTHPYVLQLAQDWRGALRKFPELKSGLQVFDGKLLHEAVAQAHQLPSESVTL